MNSEDSAQVLPPLSERNLKQLLNDYGSDKATTHDYDKIYTNFAALSGVPRTVVEIGLGTSGTGASSMGRAGRPGASVRAFRDWGANVIGADIDKSILIDEPGICCHYVDQLVPRTLANFVSALPRPIDLVIIDGLHTPEADLNSVLGLAPLLGVGGLLVVEDIEPVSEITAIWCEVVEAVPDAYRAALLATKASSVFLLIRSDNRAFRTWSDLYPSGFGVICASGPRRE